MSDHEAPINTSSSLRRLIGMALTVLGALLFLLGASPHSVGLSRTEIIGFVQITVFTFGLGVICLGGYLSLDAIWNGGKKSISAEIGARLVGTGYVIALASGMADVFGLGTRPLPSRTFFGYWQARGVLIGQAVIVVGFLMMIPYWRDLYEAARKFVEKN